MNTQPSPEPEFRRIDRILAFTSFGIIVLAVLCFVAVIVGTAVGMKHDDFQHPVWIAVSMTMYYGLPIGVGLFFVLLITTMVRRSRAAKAAEEQRKR